MFEYFSKSEQRLHFWWISGRILICHVLFPVPLLANMSWMHSFFASYIVQIVANENLYPYISWTVANEYLELHIVQNVANAYV